MDPPLGIDRPFENSVEPRLRLCTHKLFVIFLRLNGIHLGLIELGIHANCPMSHNGSRQLLTFMMVF